MKRAAGLGAMLIAAAASASLAQPPERGADVKGGSGAPVVSAIRTDKKVYKVGAPIKLTLTSKNTGKTPVKLSFDTGMRYDFTIRKSNVTSADLAWHWSRGRMFTEMLSQLTLAPGKSLTYTETFAPGTKGPDGKPVGNLGPGSYTATGVLTVGGRAPHIIVSTQFAVK